MSIQSMVFCDKPWYNEPGRERQPSESASESYNRGIHEWTVQHAMLKWLTGASTAASSAFLHPGPPHWNSSVGPIPPQVAAAINNNSGGGGGQPVAAAASTTTTVNPSDEYIWGDVVRNHFAANAKAIGETVRKWKARGLKNSKIGSLAAELNTAMVAKGYLP